MTLYYVIWDIDIEADSPEEAAYRAREMHLDPDSTATIFIVEDPNKKKTLIDTLWINDNQPS